MNSAHDIFLILSIDCFTAVYHCIPNVNANTYRYFRDAIRCTLKRQGWRVLHTKTGWIITVVSTNCYFVT